MKVIARNRRANFDYHIERTVIAGVMLTGAETKSTRGGLVSMKGSFAQVKNGELWLFNMHISPYPFAAGQPTGEPTRTRKLLINDRELQKIMSDRDDGRAVVPLAVLAGRFVKIEIGIGKGKKKYDKRHTIAARDTARSAARELKRG